MRALVIGLAALLILAGFAESPVTGLREFVVVSEEQAIQSSSVAYREMMSQLEKKKQVESGTPRAARVRAIADRLIAAAARLRPETAKWTREGRSSTSRYVWCFFAAVLSVIVLLHFTNRTTRTKEQAHGMAV